MKREDIREKTMQLVYQMDITGDFDVADLCVVEENSKVMGKKQAEETLQAVSAHHEEIDAMIADNLDRWTIDRIGRTDLAILRTAVAEMMYIDSIPRGVSINEAVDLAKKYGDERSYAFINSVLSKIDKKLEAAAD